MSEILKSKTVWLGVITVLGSLATYFHGDVSFNVAIAAAITGIIQIIQRAITIQVNS